MCKHMLAAQVGTDLGRLREVTVSDVQLARILIDVPI